MDALSLARWQFGITTVYHFFFVPLTLGLVWVVAGLRDRLVRHRGRDLEAPDEVLGQALPHQLRDGRRDGHRPGVPVRDELVRVLALRGRRVRRPARDRGTARVLPRVHLPRAVDLRLGEAAAARAPRRDLAGRDRLQRLGLLDPGRELLHAAADGLRAAQRPRGDGELLGARQQSPRVRAVPARARRRVHGRRLLRARHQRLAPRTREGRGDARGVPALVPDRRGLRPRLRDRGERRGARAGAVHGARAADEDGRGRGALGDRRPGADVAVHLGPRAGAARPLRSQGARPAELPRAQPLRGRGEGHQEPAGRVRGALRSRRLRAARDVDLLELPRDGGSRHADAAARGLGSGRDAARALRAEPAAAGAAGARDRAALRRQLGRLDLHRDRPRSRGSCSA